MTLGLSHYEINVGFSENAVLRKILEPKKEELTGNWRKLLTEELLFLFLTKYY